LLVFRSIGLLLLARSPLSIVSGTSRLLHAGSIILLAGTFAGCHKERAVAVRVSIPGIDSLESPAAGVGVIALPYDRDSVLASLDARARTPRPSTQALDSLFARFRGPFVSYTSLSYAAGRLRDSVDLLRSQLDSSASRSPEPRERATHLRRLSDSLASVDAKLRHAREALDRARGEFVRQSDSLRTILRQWEDSTYRGYDSIVENLTRRSNREGATDTTNATGWAHFQLGPGRWWLYARAWDTSDPNAEWYWNVPLESDTVLLSSRTGRRRPKY
jgi:hypothetical protein